MRLMTEFHSHGKLVKCLNPSFIVLIPKREDTSDLNDFRPISLISGVYKIITKLLCKRLSRVLESIISEQQSTFIGGRQILDSVVILNETIEDIKKKKRKTSSLLFKIYFAKAYDSVDWGYLEMLMESFNFDNKWIGCIMECVSLAQASVLVNGSPSGEFSLGRGLRQGDLLSPFLFLIAAEGLNILVSKAVNQDLFAPAEVGKDKV